jgi:hypothetical protein
MSILQTKTQKTSFVPIGFILAYLVQDLGIR